MHLFLIPFRKYFVSDMHGKFPFPGLQPPQVLVTKKVGKQARLLVVSGLIGGIYDFILRNHWIAVKGRNWIQPIILPEAAL